MTLWSPLGEKIHAFAPAASAAVALAFDRPGTDLGVALNGELAVHRIEKSRYETRRYKWPAACLTVNFSGNGRFLASGMADGSLHFWNRSTGKDSQMRGYDGKLELVGWSDNSRYLASSAGNEVVLWDFSGKGPEGTRPIVLNGHTERVDSFAWQPGGDHLVSAGRDWRLTMWRPAKTKQPIDVQMLDSDISVVRWSPDGKRAGRRREEGTRHRVRARRAMMVELRDLTPDERKEVQQRFDLLASKRFAPSPKKPRHEVWWPKAPLDGRAFPEGIQPPEGDDSFNESVRLSGFLNGVCGGEFYIANLSAPQPHFRHTGKLDAELAKWIRTRLVSNPTCLLASTLDVFLIIDSQMDYSVIGGPPEVIERFEKRFGGADGAARDVRRATSTQMRVGNGIEDLKWAQDYLQKWSGWV